MDVVLASQGYQQHLKPKIMSKQLLTEDVDRFLLKVCGEPRAAVQFRKTHATVQRSRNLLKMPSVSITERKEAPSKEAPGLLQGSQFTGISEPDDINYCILQSSEIEFEFENCASEIDCCTNVRDDGLDMHLQPQCDLEVTSFDAGSSMEWLILEELKNDGEEVESEAFFDAQVVTQAPLEINTSATTIKGPDALKLHTMEDADDFVIL